ncbi:hypothetical protein [Frigidibacter oleivorans]|uniref:hypothetical protein n=1 Tax=Frigidibacter oleivorans TaxID=2487129 RepID=UPI000F8D992E|nr:hypothetical protein [Frigidibacter oleivorans]
MRRLRRLAAGLMLALSLTGPGRTEEIAVAGALKEGDVVLEVTWTPGKGFLQGRYRLRNDGAAQLLVFDRLYHTAVTGARTVDPDHAWRWLDRDGSYRVAKTVPPVPSDRRVESPDLPYARLLPPQSALEGTVLLPLPLDQMLPYDQAPPLPPAEEVTAVTLTLGYAEVEAGTPAKALGEGADLVYSLPLGWALPRQRLVSTAPAALRLPMRKP